MLVGEVAGPPDSKIRIWGEEHPERAPTTLRLRPGPVALQLEDSAGQQVPVTVKLPGPVLVVESTPAGATLTVGSTSFGITPARVEGKLAAGVTHSLSVSHRGYVPRDVLVEDLKPGEERHIDVKLERVGAVRPACGDGRCTGKETAASCPQDCSPTRPGASAGTARLTVNIHPAAKVFLDGQLVGTTPLLLPKVAPGTHTLRFEEPGGAREKTVKVTLKAGEDKRMPLRW